MTCCVYDYFEQHSHSTTEDLVRYTCETSCVRRQSWDHDNVPHDADYCANDCPVSQFLLDRGPSDYEYDPA